MTALRQQAIEIIERIPENNLHFVIQIMKGIEGLLPTDNSEKEKAYNELLAMIEPLGITDDKAELLKYLDERYGEGL